MGLKITTDDKGLMIWRDDKGQFPNYSYSISRKDDKGGYINSYRSVRFKQGVELQNKTLISIKNAFESFNVGKDGKKYQYLMITDFDVISGGEDSGIPDMPDIPDGMDDAVPFK